MNTVTIDDKTFTAPNNWNDLSLKQQMQCYGVIMSDVPSLFDVQEVLPFKKLQLLQVLLDVDAGFMQDWEKDCVRVHGIHEGRTIFLTELDEVVQVANFLFDEQENGYAIKLGLTKCPWPILQHGKQKNRKPLRWYAPIDGMANMTIYELGVTFTLFEQYLQEEVGRRPYQDALTYISYLEDQRKKQEKQLLRNKQTA